MDCGGIYAIHMLDVIITYVTTCATLDSTVITTLRLLPVERIAVEVVHVETAFLWNFHKDSHRVLPFIDYMTFILFFHRGVPADASIFTIVFPFVVCALLCHRLRVFLSDWTW